MVVFDLLLVLPALLVPWIVRCFGESVCAEPTPEWRQTIAAILLMVAGIAAGPGLLIMLSWASFGTFVEWRDRRRGSRHATTSGGAN